jgi:hypothetical protein
MKYHYELLLSAQDGKWNARFGTLATETLELRADVKGVKKDISELKDEVRDLRQEFVEARSIRADVKEIVKKAAMVTAKKQVVLSCGGYAGRLKHVEDRLDGLDRRVDDFDEEAFRRL